MQTLPGTKVSRRKSINYKSPDLPSHFNLNNRTSTSNSFITSSNHFSPNIDLQPLSPHHKILNSKAQSCNSPPSPPCSLLALRLPMPIRLRGELLQRPMSTSVSSSNPLKMLFRHIQLTSVQYRHRLVSRSHLEMSMWTLYQDTQLTLSSYSSGALNYGYVDFDPFSTPPRTPRNIPHDLHTSSPRAISLTRVSQSIRHHSVNLAVVNMDPTSHSVYLAGGSWSGYTDYSRDVGHDGCSGENLGLLPGGCSDLDTPAGRIVCVST